MALSATVYEIGFLSAFISRNDLLAKEWLEWRDATKMPWSVPRITRGGLRNVDSEPLSDKVYVLYCSACAAKHGNPRLLRKLGVATTNDGRLLAADTEFTPGAGNTALVGIQVAGTAAMTAAAVSLNHCEIRSEDRKSIKATMDAWTTFQEALSAARGHRHKRQ